METVKIQLSKELVEKLCEMRVHSKESYENVIWDLVEDKEKLSKETEKSIKEYKEDLRKNNWKNFSSMDEVKKNNLNFLA